MDELTPDQREAIGALQASRGPCPSAETLVEYGSLSTDDRARHPAHDHISICSRCQLVLLHTAEPIVTTSSHWRWAIPIAAILVVALGVTLLQKGGTFKNPSVETIRGSEIQAVAPIGSIDTVTEFSWQSPIRADRYRVRVTRGTDTVFVGEGAGLRIDAPVGLFEPGVEYRWTVDAIDREGDVRMTSPPQVFTLSRRK